MTISANIAALEDFAETWQGRLIDAQIDIAGQQRSMLQAYHDAAPNDHPNPRVEHESTADYGILSDLYSVVSKAKHFAQTLQEADALGLDGVRIDGDGNVTFTGDDAILAALTAARERLGGGATAEQVQAAAANDLAQQAEQMLNDLFYGPSQPTIGLPFPDNWTSALAQIEEWAEWDSRVAVGLVDRLGADEVQTFLNHFELWASSDHDNDWTREQIADDLLSPFGNIVGMAGSSEFRTDTTDAIVNQLLLEGTTVQTALLLATGEYPQAITRQAIDRLLDPYELPVNSTVLGQTLLGGQQVTAIYLALRHHPDLLQEMLRDDDHPLFDHVYNAQATDAFAALLEAQPDIILNAFHTNDQTTREEIARLIHQASYKPENADMLAPILAEWMEPAFDLDHADHSSRQDAVKELMFELARQSDSAAPGAGLVQSALNMLIGRGVAAVPVVGTFLAVLYGLFGGSLTDVLFDDFDAEESREVINDLFRNAEALHRLDTDPTHRRNVVNDLARTTDMTREQAEELVDRITSVDVDRLANDADYAEQYADDLAIVVESSQWSG